MSSELIAASCIAASVLYYLFPIRLRWVALLLASYGIYASLSRQALLFILLTTVSVYCAARLIGRSQENAKNSARTCSDREEKKRIKARAKGRQRALMLLALLLNFGVLALLKYFHGQTQSLLDSALSLVGRGGVSLFVPLGISFYTFQSIGYLLDVYNGKYAPEKSLPRFALYVSFFPQLIQGPIGRYDNLGPQLSGGNTLKLDNIRRGLTLMLWGYFKKAVIADRALPLIEKVFSNQQGYGGAVIIVAVLFYSLQQYTDFSGGIDIVTGGAELMGIHLAPNFRRPYFSVSLGDFWRRWHISLGGWMRDYVFYPFALTKPMRSLTKHAQGLVGSDVARALPAALGNILVFLLVGIWHGASMNYVLWGLYNGVILAVSALLEPTFKRWNARHAQLSASRGFYLFRVLRTFLIVNIGWYFDRSADFRDAIAMIIKSVTDLRVHELFSGTLMSLGLIARDYRILAFSTVLLFAVSVLQERGVAIRESLFKKPLALRWLLLYALIVYTAITCVGIGGPANSFIYAVF